jgi:hypothetical protein
VERGSEKEAPVRFVNAYAVTRHYGGPEEGGWWYNHYDLLQSVPVDQVDAETMTEYLRLRHADVAHGDIYSVLGGCELQILTEDEPGESATKERPHYS